VVRGVIAVLFGVVALVWPGKTLLFLVLFLGAWLLVDGVLAVIAAIRYQNAPRQRWLLALEGLFGIAIGVVTFLWPGFVAVAWLYTIAIWAIITGVFEIAEAIRLHPSVGNELLMILAGLASIVLGIVLFAWPGAGLLAWVWLIGVYAIVFGVLFIGSGFRLRRAAP
jgi:uncharacterized membrane protein HdeD (DUF308 family)